MFYLYIRTNYWWDSWGLRKVGIFREELKDNRNSNYKTGEPREGYYETIYEIQVNNMNTFDRWLKRKMINYQYIDKERNGGTEFYYKDNLELNIENILTQYHIKYDKLNQEKIEKLERKRYDEEISINYHIEKEIKDYEKKLLIKQLPELYQFQQEVDIINYLIYDKKGILNWSPRLGKTIKSIDTILKMDVFKILIGVPSIDLIYQWKTKIEKYCYYPLLIVGDNMTNDIELRYNTSEFLVVLVTYNSSYKLLNYEFDLKILDEVHHLCYQENKENLKCYQQILNIKSKYQLSLTATLKQSNGNLIGNDNMELFGNIIDTKTLTWGIENNYVCDYEICTPITNKDIYDDILYELGLDDTPSELLITCIQILKVLQLNNPFKYNHSHCINFTNTIKNAKICKNIIDKLLTLEEFKNLQDKIYNRIVSETNSKELQHILEEYRNYEKGILHSCYKLGEGFDEKQVDMLCITENMNSYIRITQTLLRPHTKNEMKKDKKALILIPTIISYEEECNSNDYKNIKIVLEELTKIDSNVVDKLKCIKLDKHKRKYNKNEYQDIENNILFTETMKLKFIHKNLINGCSYTKIKEIIQRLGNDIIDKTPREDYIEKYNNCHNLPSLDVIETILNHSKKSWLDLYSINISNYYSYNEFYDKYNNLHDIDKYIEVSKLDDKSPPYNLLEDIYKHHGYNMNFWNIHNIDTEF